MVPRFNPTEAMNDMSMMISMLRHYVSRFGREVLVYWGVAAGSGYVVATGAAPSVCLALGRVEVVATVWITVRILLAEEGLGTSGGWRVRPVPRWAPSAARVVLLAAAMLVPWLCKAGLLWHYLALDLAGWHHLAGRVWLPQAVIWLAFAVAVALVARWIRRREGSAGSVVWSGFAIALVVGTLLVCARKPGKNQNYEEKKRFADPESLVQGIRHALPTAKDFLGFTDGNSETAPRAKVLLRVPLGVPQALGNLRLVKAAVSLRGVRTEVVVHLVGINGKLWEDLTHAPVLVRYADGTYAACRQNHRARDAGASARPVVESFRFRGSFLSPLCLPEFERRGASLPEAVELLFFGEDREMPALSVPPEIRYRQPYSNDKPIPLPPTLTPDHPDPLAAEVNRLIDLSNLTWNFRRVSVFPDDLAGRIAKLPPESVPWVLRRLPWTDSAWRELVHPVLLKHAERKDLPMVLDLLEFDPRLGVLCVEKGWTREALPLLKRFVRDRLPMDAACVKLVAEAKDVELADDLAVVALRLGGKVGAVEDALREHPGFDWAAFVKRGWWQVKYGGFQNDNGYTEFRKWAVREGDHSALRSLVSGTVTNDEDRIGTLRALVAAEPENIISYLRENMDRMTFDPVIGKWRLD